MPSTTCPACGASATGHFCASCGASLTGGTCAACRVALSPGARFCHRCGTQVGTAPARRAAAPSRDPLPWAVALIALCALIALVAAQRVGIPQGSTLDAPINAIPVPGLDFPQGSAPDISGMSPRERAAALYDRIVRLHEQGNIDSARFIAFNMAIPQLRMMDTLDADLRYDLGRIGEMTGAIGVATAQADSILAEHPSHLLGLLLASRAARASGDEARARTFEQRLIAAERTERAKQLPEYEMHSVDIDNALAEARRTPRSPPG